MTIPAEGFAGDAVTDIYPIDVRIIGPHGGGDIAPDFGACTNVTVILASAGIPVQLLQRRPLREQAFIRNTDPANAIMFAERIDKLQQPSPQGYILPAGQIEKVESQQPYWAIALTAPVVVSVRDETWAEEGNKHAGNK